MLNLEPLRNQEAGRWGRPQKGNTTKVSVDSLHFHFAMGFSHPLTCMHERLPGPCFKTGASPPFNQTSRNCKDPPKQVTGINLQSVEYLNPTASTVTHVSYKQNSPPQKEYPSYLFTCDVAAAELMLAKKRRRYQKYSIS